MPPTQTNQQKTQLANATGLTRMQVSNYFINARVRIWRPMVFKICEEGPDPLTARGDREEEDPPTTPQQSRRKGRAV